MRVILEVELPGMPEKYADGLKEMMQIVAERWYNSARMLATNERATTGYQWVKLKPTVRLDSMDGVEEFSNAKV
jgi:hypothetical protein